jgi:hypothetical protein
MAHFAKVNEHGIVVNVFVADQEWVDTFIDDTPGWIIQTSYNTIGGVHYTQSLDGGRVPSEDQTKALRKNYAGIGFTYDSERDAFIPPKPYPSWVLNEDTCLWEAPIPNPEGWFDETHRYFYVWNEETASWDEKSRLLQH